jgi:hypothetical protein
MDRMAARIIGSTSNLLPQRTLIEELQNNSFRHRYERDTTYLITNIYVGLYALLDVPVLFIIRNAWLKLKVVYIHKHRPIYEKQQVHHLVHVQKADYFWLSTIQMPFNAA